MGCTCSSNVSTTDTPGKIKKDGGNSIKQKSFHRNGDLSTPGRGQSGETQNYQEQVEEMSCENRTLVEEPIDFELFPLLQEMKKPDDEQSKVFKDGIWDNGSNSDGNIKVMVVCRSLPTAICTCYISKETTLMQLREKIISNYPLFCSTYELQNFEFKPANCAKFEGSEEVVKATSLFPRCAYVRENHFKSQIKTKQSHPNEYANYSILRVIYIDSPIGRKNSSDILFRNIADQLQNQKLSGDEYRKIFLNFPSQMCYYRDFQGRTLLHYAALFGKVPAVKILITCGSPLECKDCDGKTALHLAASRGFNMIVEIICSEPACINTSDSRGRTPLHCAINARQWDTVDILMKNNANPSITDEKNDSCLKLFMKKFPFEVLSNEDRVDIVEKCLSYGFFSSSLLQKKDHLGRIPLIHSIQNSNSKMISFLLSSMVDPISHFLDQRKSTPLHYAVKNQDVDLVRQLLLLDQQLVDMQDVTGKTPLMMAIAEKCEPIIRFLLTKKQNYLLYDTEGCTVLHYAIACKMQKFVPSILQAEPSLATFQGILKKERIHKQQRYKHLDYQREFKGPTALVIACTMKDIESMKIIVQTNVNAVHCEDHNHRTALSVCCSVAFQEGINFLVQQMKTVSLGNLIEMFDYNANENAIMSALEKCDLASEWKDPVNPLHLDKFNRSISKRANTQLFDAVIGKITASNSLGDVTYLWIDSSFPPPSDFLCHMYDEFTKRGAQIDVSGTCLSLKHVEESFFNHMIEKTDKKILGMSEMVSLFEIFARKQKWDFVRKLLQKGVPIPESVYHLGNLLRYCCKFAPADVVCAVFKQKPSLLTTPCFRSAVQFQREETICQLLEVLEQNEIRQRLPENILSTFYREVLRGGNETASTAIRQKFSQFIDSLHGDDFQSGLKTMNELMFSQFSAEEIQKYWLQDPKKTLKSIHNAMYCKHENEIINLISRCSDMVSMCSIMDSDTNTSLLHLAAHNGCCNLVVFILEVLKDKEKAIFSKNIDELNVIECAFAMGNLSCASTLISEVSMDCFEKYEFPDILDCGLGTLGLFRYTLQYHEKHLSESVAEKVSYSIFFPWSTYTICDLISKRVFINASYRSLLLLSAVDLLDTKVLEVLLRVYRKDIAVSNLPRKCNEQIALALHPYLPDKEELLRKAIDNNWLQFLSKLKQEGVDIMKLSENETSLDYAICMGKLEVAKLLLQGNQNRVSAVIPNIHVITSTALAVKAMKLPVDLKVAEYPDDESDQNIKYVDIPEMGLDTYRTALLSQHVDPKEIEIILSGYSQPQK